MTEETTGLPSQADLDAVNAEAEVQKATAGPAPEAKAAHDALIADLTAPVKPKEPEPPEELPPAPPPVPPELQHQGPALPPDEPVISRHGEQFNPDIHAQLPTGDPKTDSTGKFILKEHDYRGPRPNSQFPD